MLPGMSPQKRKCSEYRDPDYASEQSSSNNPSKRRHFSSGPNLEAGDVKEEGKRLQRIREVVTREFEREISFKQQQLEQVDGRLAQAQLLLSRLRYAIVAEYYQKQEIPLSQADVKAVRGTQILFEEEHAGPQMPLHPSLKKIIGKRPCDYAEILRTCPKRAAAQNAKQTIQTKTPLQRRQERRLQQMIREQGIVIDHSKQSSQDNSVSLAAAATAEMLASPNENLHSISKTGGAGNSPCTPRLQQPAARKALNAARLNNKVKYLIVVGNTSKYIGAEGNDRPEDRKSSSQTLTHKWLVYIQTKDTDVPLENIVRKIRFFLHPSYRPNDVVDIYKPPFQLARRGWGEFPVRIQLFFHNHLQQKPVQLVHNLVLDKTLNGMHSLGAETVVEVWLRSCDQHEKQPSSSSTRIDFAVNQQQMAAEAPHTISTEQHISSLNPIKEELDDNLLEFLNKIGETPTSISADIEKIEPTILVSEPLTNIVGFSKMEIKSPQKQNTELHANVSTLPASRSLASSTTTTTADREANSIKTPCVISPSHVPKEEPKLALVQNSSAAVKNNVLNLNNNTPALAKTDLRIFSKPNNNIENNRALIVSKEGKLMLSAVQLPSSGVTKSVLHPTPFAVNDISKRILQKKLVQLVDATGKVKYMQMLVATTISRTVVGDSSKGKPIVTVAANSTTTSSTAGTKTAISTIVSNSNSERQLVEGFKTPAAAATYSPKERASTEKTDTLTTLPKTKNNAPKNVVFQKEGKLYIIDPLQMKLKQQQKKQISLLKPQIRLLKIPQSNIRVHSAVSDHDYVPTPICVQAEAPSIAGERETQLLEPPQSVQLHMRQKRLTASSARELQLLKRTKFEQSFLKENVVNMRMAVEYLLRRLPLVATLSAAYATAFPFVQDSLQKFETLTAIKQRACEWLRAKCISRMLRNHKDLQQLEITMQDYIWSTKEIVIFARLHAYTPVLKALPQFKHETQPQQFTQLVKTEVENEQQQHELQCDTLTAQGQLSNWVEREWNKLQQQEDLTEEQKIIDVDSLPSQNDETQPSSTHAAFTRQTLSDSPNAQVVYMLPTVKHLEHETNLVGQICKDLFIQLEPKERVDENIVHPLAQTLLAQSLHTFVEKLLRKTVALKLQQQRTLSGEVHDLTVYAHDVSKAVARTDEFDFLTNSSFGTAKHED